MGQTYEYEMVGLCNFRAFVCFLKRYQKAPTSFPKFFLKILNEHLESVSINWSMLLDSLFSFTIIQYWIAHKNRIWTHSTELKCWLNVDVLIRKRVEIEFPLIISFGLNGKYPHRCTSSAATTKANKTKTSCQIINNHSKMQLILFSLMHFS